VFRFLVAVRLLFCLFRVPYAQKIGTLHRSRCTLPRTRIASLPLSKAGREEGIHQRRFRSWHVRTSAAKPARSRLFLWVHLFLWATPADLRVIDQPPANVVSTAALIVGNPGRAVQAISRRFNGALIAGHVESFRLRNGITIG
jgi:hypothetical protein